MKKVFLDTNIFIDFFEKTRENNQQAKQLIYFLISNDIKIIFSEDMISTV
ncbi:DNA-binding protein, partial [Campylobacter coli]|nr:DNA-binding protein [Campylobacter coli]